MKFIIRKIRRRPNGQVLAKDQDVDKAALTVGRSTECDIYLPDLRVSLDHAQIDTTGSSFRISSLGERPIKADGKFGNRFTFSRKETAEVEIGPYLLQIFNHEESDAIVVSFERVEEETPALQGKDEEAIFSLKSAVPGKRPTSWLVLLFIFGLFLAVPVYWFYTDKPAKIFGYQPDDPWLTGTVSSVHSNIAGDCKTCHQVAFKSAGDDVCLDCHENTRNHAEVPDLRTARAPLSPGQTVLRTVATAFQLPQERCTSCHMEHNGPDAMILSKQALCTDCHTDMDTRLTKTEYINVTDFSGDNHPNFRPSVVVSPDRMNPVIERISMDDNPVEVSGIKFPHDMHLLPDDAVAKQAQELSEQFGFGEKLECEDCHKPDAANALFNPISMEENCAMCHSLEFERDENGVPRTLRHGEPKDVIASMRDYYTAAAVLNIAEDTASDTVRRPGSAAQLREDRRREVAIAQAESRAAIRVREIFTRREGYEQGGICFECHTVIEPTDPNSIDFDISPVSLADKFMPNTRYVHAAHKIGDPECTDCHDAENSKEATDVLMPDIETCYECHGGEKSVDLVPSTCMMCHDYHDETHGPFMEPAQLRNATLWPFREDTDWAHGKSLETETVATAYVEPLPTAAGGGK